MLNSDFFGVVNAAYYGSQLKLSTNRRINLSVYKGFSADREAVNPVSSSHPFESVNHLATPLGNMANFPSLENEFYSLENSTYQGGANLFQENGTGAILFHGTVFAPALLYKYNSSARQRLRALLLRLEKLRSYLAHGLSYAARARNCWFSKLASPQERDRRFIYSSSVPATQLGGGLI